MQSHNSVESGANALLGKPPRRIRVGRSDSRPVRIGEYGYEQRQRITRHGATKVEITLRVSDNQDQPASSQVLQRLRPTPDGISKSFLYSKLANMALHVVLQCTKSNRYASLASTMLR